MGWGWDGVSPPNLNGLETKRLFFSFCLYQMACTVLSPWTRNQTRTPAVKALSPDHCSIRSSHREASKFGKAYKACVSYRSVLACHLPSTSAKIKWHAAAADLQRPLQEFRLGSRNEASVLRGNWQDRLSDSWIFSGADFMSPILVSPHL